jgi:hypothetical protein
MNTDSKIESETPGRGERRVPPSPNFCLCVAPRSPQCYPPTSSRAAKNFPERGLSQAVAASLKNGGWDYRTAFRIGTRCGLGQPALRFGGGFAALRLCVDSVSIRVHPCPSVVNFFFAQLQLRNPA